MTGQELLKEYEKEIPRIDTIEQGQIITDVVHSQLLELHARALACHCECLGMNAENSYACCVGTSIPYRDDSYAKVMEKWGIINKEGEPSI